MEVILAIKTAGPVEDCGIQTLGVIGSSQHNNAIVRFKSIELIEEERAAFVSNHRVEIFQHKEAGRSHSCAFKNQTHVLLVSCILGFKTLHVDAGLTQLID